LQINYQETVTATKEAICLLNVLAFASLFIVYTTPRPVERMAGVRRMLQTYAGQVPAGRFPTRKSVWQIGVSVTEMI
jgi:hypothetical protein